MEPLMVTKDIYILDDHTEVNMMDIGTDKNERIELRYYADPYIDGRRVWRLFSVWFDGKPVMICQRAGREGRDYRNTIVTDNQAFREMNDYLWSLREDYVDEEDIWDPEQEIGGLTEFYGYSLKEAREQRQTIHSGEG
jgi:hypothetical protein